MHKLINLLPATDGNTGVARNFDCGGVKMKKFCDIFRWHNGHDIIKWRHNWFLKFDFVIISLKKQNLTTSRNFRSPKSKIKAHWGRRAVEWKLIIFPNSWVQTEKNTVIPWYVYKTDSLSDGSTPRLD